MGYNSFKFKGRYKSMKAQFSTTNCTSNRCAAVACSSAVTVNLLDTAIILAVSICVLCLLPLRILV